MAGWSFISWMEGSRACLALKLRSQALMSARREEMSMATGEKDDSEEWIGVDAFGEK